MVRQRCAERNELPVGVCCACAACVVALRFFLFLSLPQRWPILVSDRRFGFCFLSGFQRAVFSSFFPFFFYKKKLKLRETFLVIDIIGKDSQSCNKQHTQVCNCNKRVRKKNPLPHVSSTGHSSIPR